MKPRNRLFTPLAALVLAVSFTAHALEQSAAPFDERTEANITRVTAGLLGSSQFAHHPLDDELASLFFDRYLDALDGERVLFLQSDVAEFAPYRATLAAKTLRDGDTELAHLLFERYLLRLGQRVAYVNDRLRSATFDFTRDAEYAADRKDAARPRDLDAARALWWQRLQFEYLQEKLDGKQPAAIVATLGARADRVLRMTKQTSRDDVLEIYLSALARVYDPHSDYLGAKQTNEFAISMNLSLFGIGATLQSRDGYCRIVDLLPGGPAMRSGLLGPGDRIVAVAQEDGDAVDVVEMPLARIVELIRGPKGTVVKLVVIPANAVDGSVRKTVCLVRDEIRIEEQRAKATIVEHPNGPGSTLRLGVIELPSFYTSMGDSFGGKGRGARTGISASADVARLLDKLQAERVRGVVLDLRRNGGGSLAEAIRLTGLFITQGPVVQTRGPRGDIDVESDTDPAQQYSGPLIVLTSRFSASASEILAGALQDYGRALIVGDPATFGKGTVQSVIALAPIMDRSRLAYAYDPGALTVTIRKFYRPSGSSTQLRGVVPDIVLPSLSAISRAAESELDNPLPWDAVPAARYRRQSTLDAHLATLRARSARRVAEAEDFALLRDEIARLQDRLATRTVSLNEAVRRQELAQFEQRNRERAIKIKALQAAAPTTYEITVANAHLAGLPPPSGPAGQSGARDPEATAGEPGPGEDPPQDDPVLREAQKILADYIELHVRAEVPRTGHTPLAATAWQGYRIGDDPGVAVP